MRTLIHTTDACYNNKKLVLILEVLRLIDKYLYKKKLVTDFFWGILIILEVEQLCVYVYVENCLIMSTHK